MRLKVFCYGGRLETHLKVLRVFVALFREPITICTEHWDSIPMDIIARAKKTNANPTPPHPNCNPTPVVGVHLSFF